ncbi:Protease inhibitor [Paenibacillus solanacearum]|uniref:Protease inhibitor n=1 Tax=Paenibacillus solanacearum TaxID=2048548 RepID=A0A916NLY1_9BACL|nr:copper amine oxidase N-terminal domain-containing protein [Paenibacillus solanacearum]CAG7652596.1 Protease inhibitor [Paenibacillus solanacearum]
MNYRMNKRIAAIVALSISLTGGAAYAADTTPQPIQAKVISAPITNEPFQIIVNGSALAIGGFKAADAKEPMLPLRDVTEALGFTLTWNAESMSADLVKQNLMVTVTTGEDRYAVNKMDKTLGTAPALVDSRLFVPASFASEVLRADVKIEGSTVSITQDEQRKTTTTKGVVTAVRDNEGHQAVQINGVGPDGLVLNVGKDTVIASSEGTVMAFSDLTIGTEIEAEHSLAMTMSLPPQTAAYNITVSYRPDAVDLTGTSGKIQDVRKSDDGVTSIVIKGAGLTEQSQAEVVLQLTDQTTLVNKEGEAIDKDALVQGAKVIGFYNGVLTKSLPPIGKAWKVVLMAPPAE